MFFTVAAPFYTLTESAQGSQSLNMHTYNCYLLAGLFFFEGGELAILISVK